MASVDTPEDNTKFAAEHNAGYPILSDPSKETSRSYGVLMKFGDNEFANRWTFYIDIDGNIAKIDKEVKPASAGADMVKAMGELEFKKAS